MLKRGNGRTILSILLAAAVALMYVPAVTLADAPQKGVVIAASSLRAEASSGAAVLLNLPVDSVIDVTATVPAGEETWYQVSLTVSGEPVTGYVPGTDVTLMESAFEQHLLDQNFPESYKNALRVLHVKYPNWVFRAFQTGLQWSDVIAAESIVGRNLVSSTSDPSYIDLTDVDENGNQKGRDGSKWVAASRFAVEYYMDPRNFLTDPYVFMFESLSYSAENHTITGVQAILKNTFMAGSYTCPDTSVTYTYADTFMAAAVATGVSPYHLASRARQEQGVNGNLLGLGTVPGYANFFNFFNIGAFATSTGTALVNGAIYASTPGTYGRPWTNQYKSIMGGASFLGNSYISVGQDTLYFQKFNVSNAANLYNHQYMTNVKAPYSESVSIKKAYSECGDDILKSALIFKIPVYLNMPEQAIPKPESRTEPLPGTGSAVITANPYFMSGAIMTKVPENTTAEGVRAALLVTDGFVKVFAPGGAEMASGSVGTGCSVTIFNTDGTVYATYTVVMYGDINGDSTITIADLVTVRKHLLDIAKLSGGPFVASDINKDGSITIADLVFVRKHLLDLSKISQ